MAGIPCHPRRVSSNCLAVHFLHNQLDLLEVVFRIPNSDLGGWETIVEHGTSWKRNSSIVSARYGPSTARRDWRDGGA